MQTCASFRPLLGQNSTCRLVTFCLINSPDLQFFAFKKMEYTFQVLVSSLYLRVSAGPNEITRMIE